MIDGANDLQAEPQGCSHRVTSRALASVRHRAHFGPTNSSGRVPCVGAAVATYVPPTDASIRRRHISKMVKRIYIQAATGVWNQSGDNNKHSNQGEAFTETRECQGCQYNKLYANCPPE